MPRVYPLHSPTMKDVMRFAPELESLFVFCRWLFRQLDSCAKCIRSSIRQQTLEKWKSQSNILFQRLFLALNVLLIILSVTTLLSKNFSGIVYHLYFSTNAMVLTKYYFLEQHNLPDEPPQHCIMTPVAMSPCLYIMKSLVLVHAGLQPWFVIPVMLHSLLDLSHYLLNHLSPEVQICVAVRPLYDYLRVPVKMVEAYADMCICVSLVGSSYTLAAIYSMIFVLKLEHSNPSRKSLWYLVLFIDRIFLNLNSSIYQHWSNVKNFLAMSLEPAVDVPPPMPKLSRKKRKPQSPEPSIRLASFALDTIEVINDLN
ncbi:hypothetical protein QA089_001372 [Meyerozyma guilliermondii]